MNSIVQRSMKRARSAFAIFPLLHAVEMRAQPVETLAAEVELCLHPLLHLVEPPLVQAVDTRGSLGAIRDEAALAQHLEVTRDRWPRHFEAPRDIARIALPAGQHRHDFAAGGIGEGFERIHAPFIANLLYSSQAKQ